jgi:hypothetical protein
VLAPAVARPGRYQEADVAAAGLRDLVMRMAEIAADGLQ